MRRLIKEEIIIHGKQYKILGFAEIAEAKPKGTIELRIRLVIG